MNRANLGLSIVPLIPFVTVLPSKEVRCPNCRSLLKATAVFSPLRSPALQILICPVCGQEINLARGLLPLKWSVSKVIERGPEPIQAPKFPGLKEEGIIWEPWPKEEKYWYQKPVEAVIEKIKEIPAKVPWGKIALYSFLAVAAIVVLKTATREVIKKV